MDIEKSLYRVAVVSRKPHSQCGSCSNMRQTFEINNPFFPALRAGLRLWTLVIGCMLASLLAGAAEQPFMVIRLNSQHHPGVHEVSPQTRTGFQHCVSAALVNGPGWVPVFKALHDVSGLPVGSRPGAGCYTDSAPRGMIERRLIWPGRSGVCRILSTSSRPRSKTAGSTRRARPRTGWRSIQCGNERNQRWNS